MYNLYMYILANPDRIVNSEVIAGLREIHFIVWSVSHSAECESGGLLRKSPPDTPENVVDAFSVNHSFCLLSTLSFLPSSIQGLLRKSPPNTKQAR